MHVGKRLKRHGEFQELVRLIMERVREKRGKKRKREKESYLPATFGLDIQSKDSFQVFV